MPFNPNIVDHIVNSLDKYKSEEVLTKIYQWPINNAVKKLAEFDVESASNVNGENSFEKTLSIRKIVQEKLLEKDISKEENSKYIFWIIKDWGGITRIKDNILQSIRKKEETASFDCTSIASWSKYFAFKYPEKYAIYDARVIYSLNWLLLKASSETFFPTPSGRNSLMNALDFKMMVLVKLKGKNTVKNAIADDIKSREKTPGVKSRVITTLSKGLYIKNDSAYLDYCSLLKDISIRLFSDADPHALTKTEMILFAIADKDIVTDVLEHQY